MPQAVSTLFDKLQSASLSPSDLAVQSADEPKPREGAKSEGGGQDGQGHKPEAPAVMPAVSERSSTMAEEASRGALWGQISRCWKPDAAKRRVVIELVLDAEGQLRSAPKIVRTGDMTLDQQQLRAERRALTAVVRCVPYRVTGSEGVHVVDFQPKI